LVIEFVNIYGKNWGKIAKFIPTRNGKQIRDRYLNSLDPSINKTKFNDEEDKKLISCYKEYGPKWSFISEQFNGRTGDMIKNRFYSCLEKNVHKYKISKKYVNARKKDLKPRKRMIKNKKKAIIRNQNKIESNKENENNENHNGNSTINNSSPSISKAEDNNSKYEVMNNQNFAENSSKNSNKNMAGISFDHSINYNIYANNQALHQYFQNFLNFNLAFHVNQLNQNMNHFKMLNYFSGLNAIKK